MKPFGVVKGIRRRLGVRGETTAARLLEIHGCQILCRNYRCRAGELDLVVLDGGILLFIEVKTLREKPGFAPAGNLSAAQCRRNFSAAMQYLAMLHYVPAAWRFDLIEVVFRGRRVASLRRHPDYLPPHGTETVAEALARRPFWGYII